MAGTRGSFTSSKRLRERAPVHREPHLVGARRHPRRRQHLDGAAAALVVGQLRGVAAAQVPDEAVGAGLAWWDAAPRPCPSRRRPPGPGLLAAGRAGGGGAAASPARRGLRPARERADLAAVGVEEGEREVAGGRLAAASSARSRRSAGSRRRRAAAPSSRRSAPRLADTRSRPSRPSGSRPRGRGRASCRGRGRRASARSRRGANRCASRGGHRLGQLVQRREVVEDPERRGRAWRPRGRCPSRSGRGSAPPAGSTAAAARRRRRRARPTRRVSVPQ